MKELIALIRKYGFVAVRTKKVYTIAYGEVEADAVIVKSKNTDRESTKWFTVIPKLPKNVCEEQTVFVVGNNTDQCDIWLCNTRKDLTADKLISFFCELEDLLNLSGNERNLLKTFVDPEDWQAIAHVHDAYEDKRYNQIPIQDMKIEIKFKGLSNECITSLKIGNELIEWKTSEITADGMVGLGVSINGTSGSKRIDELKYQHVSEIQTNLKDDDIEIISITIEDNGEIYEVSEWLYAKYTRKNLKTENLDMHITGQQYNELVALIHKESYIENLRNAIENDDNISDEDANLLLDKCRVSAIAEKYEDKMCELITGEKEQEILADLLNEVKSNNLL